MELEDNIDYNIEVEEKGLALILSSASEQLDLFLPGLIPEKYSSFLNLSHSLLKLRSRTFKILIFQMVLILLELLYMYCFEVMIFNMQDKAGSNSFVLTAYHNHRRFTGDKPDFRPFSRLVYSGMLIVNY